MLMETDLSNPFISDGIWLKGNLHTHTTCSDGDLEPAEIVRHYAEAGYDFLAITDHNRLTLPGGEEKHGLLLIPGEEIDIGRSAAGTTFHFVALGIKNEWKRPPHTSPHDIPPQALIDEVREAGGVVILCHPYWSQLTMDDMLPLNGYIGIEVFNTSCHHSIGKGFSGTHWDDLLTRGRPVWGLAVDDAHYHFNEHRPVDLCGGWVMVKCRERSESEIIRALQQGMFYSSAGPDIYDVRFDERSVFIRTSPVTSITFIADNGKGEKWTAISEKTITEARYNLRGIERFLRVECQDGNGNCAWTNPLLLKPID